MVYSKEEFEREFQTAFSLTLNEYEELDLDTGRRIISTIIGYRMNEKTTSWQSRTPLPDQISASLKHHKILPGEWSMYKSLAGRFFSLRSARKRSAAAAKRNESKIKKALPTNSTDPEPEVFLKGNQYTWKL